MNWGCTSSPNTIIRDNARQRCRRLAFTTHHWPSALIVIRAMRPSSNGTATWHVDANSRMVQPRGCVYPKHCEETTHDVVGGLHTPHQQQRKHFYMSCWISG